MSFGDEAWRIRAEIDHAALRHNARAVKESVGPDTGLIAVVKADGYGHGAAEVARTLAPFAAKFGVATLGEARAVRSAVPDHDILLLSPCLPAERAGAVSGNFIPVVSSAAEARACASSGAGQPVRVHLCIDTGMGRIGIWQEDAITTAREIAAHPGLQIESISTHLPVADTDPDFTASELEAWSALKAKLREIVPDAKFHALNSAASLERPQHASDLVRPGLALYGISPLPRFHDRLQPVMTLKTRITLIRDVGAGRGISYGRDFITPQPMRVATLAMGYADGYPRQTSNRGAHVLIRGQRCPVLGRITMDQFMVDVSSLPRDVAPGEEVVLFGKQDEAVITVGEVAAWAGTIPWDILTRLGRRVELAHFNRTVSSAP
ncbi:MAG: alanine racemase [Chthoniobacterales bacterium]|nr:alanine racemase [Chthoniobacterales bacterium]